MLERLHYLWKSWQQNTCSGLNLASKSLISCFKVDVFATYKPISFAQASASMLHREAGVRPNAKISHMLSMQTCV